MKTPTSVVDQQLVDFSLRFLESLNTARSLLAAIHIRYGLWDQLVTLSCSPMDYLDVPSGIERYRRDVQAFDLLRKVEDLPTSWKRAENALSSFEMAEDDCTRTNVRLRLLQDCPRGPLEYAALDILKRAKNWLKRVVGPMPSNLNGRYGPGTSFELKDSPFTTVLDKITTQHCATSGVEPYFRLFTRNNILDRVLSDENRWPLITVPGNRFTTVPKDGVKDRGISIEPLANIYCQLGVGAHLKERCAAIGLYIHRAVPLTPLEWTKCDRPTRVYWISPWGKQVRRRRPDGQNLHRQLAEQSSRDCMNCTIDLSSASDTVALELVRALFPEDWFRLLDDLRSKRVRLPNGAWRYTAKFSSMGNGYTFEMETLVFASLLAGIGLRPGSNCWVYGDDIIAPTDRAREIIAVLRFFGFTPNPKKTFTTGHFRESCGGDYFNGVDVRPFQLKRQPDSPHAWMVLHNHLRHRWGNVAWRALRSIPSYVPKEYRLFGPASTGDATFNSRWHGSYRPSRKRGQVIELGGKKWTSDYQTWAIHCLGSERPPSLSVDRWGFNNPMLGMVYISLLGTIVDEGVVPRGGPPPRPCVATHFA